MDKLSKYIKIEADMEFFACVQGASMIFLYGCLRWFAGEPNVPFSVIFVQMVLGYVISWTQKLIFLREKRYSRLEYRMREVLWCAFPMILLMLTGYLFRWFEQTELWVEIIFYLLMLGYFIMLRFFLKYFYKEDTGEMNQLLQERKREEKING